MDFKAIDEKPVHFFFLIVAPPLEVSNQYLPVLGKIAQFSKESDVPQRLLEISQEQAVIRFEAQADRFLKQMVRAMVGTLVEVGRGKRPPKNVKEILEARDRRAAGVTAPAHGLYLVRVDY